MDISVLKQPNMRAFVETLRSRGCMGRREIVEATGMSFPTVCRLANELIEASIISPIGAISVGNAKRKTTLLGINPDGGWIVAMEVGGGHIKAAAMDMIGNLHETVEHPLDNISGEESVTPALVSVLTEIISRCEPSRGKPFAVGISSAGMVDTEYGIVKLSFNLQLNNFPIAKVVQRVCNVPVVLHDNIVSSTLAEARLGHGQNNDNFAYIAVGVGMGGNFVINRQLYPLASVSQFGLTIVAPEGDPDRFGGRGYLESLASGRGIAAAARRALESGVKSKITDLVPKGPTYVTAKDVADAANMGDELARSIFAQATSYLAIGIVNVANLFGLNMFVINGGVSKSGEAFWSPLTRWVREYEYWPGQIRLEPSRLEGDAAVLGAGLLALDKVFELAE